MRSSKQVDLDELIGKKLEFVAGEFGGSVLLVFEGEPVVLTAEPTCGNDDPYIEQPHFVLSEWMDKSQDLVRLGVVTQAEVDEQVAQERKIKQAQIERKRREIEILEEELGQ